MNSGGRIFLNGTGTEQHPYGCDGDNHPGITVNKTLKMTGLYHTPYISCHDGIRFRNSHDELQIKLLGIAFRQTPLIFEDCIQVKVSNCTFQNASTAFNIQIQNRSSFQIDIQSSMFFYNSPFCIKLLLPSKNTSQSLDVAVKIFDTKFVDNGVLNRQSIERGVVVIKSKDETVSSDTHIHTFFENVTCKRNHGPFVTVNVSKAVTDEIYKDIYVKHNTMPSSGKKSDVQLVNSLYHSATKETHTKFINFQCMQNTMLRCIEIQSDKADVNIRESTFVGHNLTKEGAALRLDVKLNASLKVLNTNFTNNMASEGGAVFANSPNGTLNLNFSNCNFTGCSANKTGRGCAISVGRPPNYGNARCPSKLNFTISYAIFSNCHGNFYKCVTVFVRFNSGKVEIKESKWVNNLRNKSGSLHVFSETAKGEANVTISRSSFTDNEGSAISISATNTNAGNATVVDNLISANYNFKNRPKTALWINPHYQIKLENITVANFRYGVKSIGRRSTHGFPVNIVVFNCTLINNIYDMLLTFLDPTSIQLMIKNTVFTSNEIREKSYAIRLHIPPLRNGNSSDAVIELDNNTFDYRPSSSFALFFRGNKTLSIRRSTFRNCICLYREKWSLSNGSFYETATGALSILTNPDKLLQSGCVHLNAKTNIHPLWTYRSHVLIEDTIFHNNAGLVAGAVYISNGYTKFERCAFQDNFGIEQTGHVYSAYGTGQVHFKDCSLSTTKTSMTILNNTTFNKATFMYSESGGPMKFQNTSMRLFVAKKGSYPLFDISNGGYVEVDDNTTIQCSKGSQLLFENTTHFLLTEDGQKNNFCKINVTSLKFSCKSCSPGYYSLQRGSMRGLTLNGSFQCLPCPFGATCIQSNIVAKPNFWGQQISEHPQSLHFIACPEDYCQSPASGSKDYNSCQGKRTGILCGVCAPGYSESLLSTGCLPADECVNKWFWILTFLAITAFALYLLTKPPILKFLGRQILWCKRREQHQVREDLGRVEEHFDSGYLKIAFYFYQVAELLTVGSTDDLLHKVPFIPAMVASFNFRIRAFRETMRCPFVGLTVITKELLLSGTVFVTMAAVVIIYFMHLCFNIARHKALPSPELYIAVIIEIMLLGYERLVETSFKLMDCVPIGPAEKRLFFDGTVLCWQWWQYTLLAYTIVFVVPFIFVLYFGSSKVYRASISATEFLCACILPLPFLIYWFIKGVLKNRERHDATRASVQLVNQHVLDVLIGPFRPPNGEDKGTLYWESILIGRRFILLACHAFLDDVMLCGVVMTFACVLMLLHHVWKNPYRDSIANGTETVSLLVLVIIALINLTKATLISFGTTPAGPSKSYIQAMDWVQILALTLLPLLLSLYVVLAILSQLFRLIVLLAKHTRCCLQMAGTSMGTTEELRPLID